MNSPKQMGIQFDKKLDSAHWRKQNHRSTVPGMPGNSSIKDTQTSLRINALCVTGVLAPAAPPGRDRGTALSGGFLDTFVLTGTARNRCCLCQRWSLTVEVSTPAATNTAARRQFRGPFEVAEGFGQPFRFLRVESMGPYVLYLLCILNLLIFFVFAGWMKSIGYQILYELDHRMPVLYVVPVYYILGKLPLVPVGDSDTGTIQHHPRNLFQVAPGNSGRAGAGDGCRMWFVNSWAMVWSRDM
jgi:hypothetical protein